MTTLASMALTSTSTSSVCRALTSVVVLVLVVVVVLVWFGRTFLVVLALSCLHYCFSPHQIQIMSLPRIVGDWFNAQYLLLPR